MIQREMADPFEIEEFTFIELHNLPSTYAKAQIFAVVPTEMYLDRLLANKLIWINIDQDEAAELLQGVVSDSVKLKVAKRA